MSVDRLNLIPRDLQIKAGPDFDKLVVMAAGAIFAIVALFSVLQFRTRSAKEEVLRGLASQNTALKTQVDALTAANSTGVDRFQARIEATRELLKNKIIWSEAFKELSLVTPANVWLVNLRSSLDDKDKGKRKYILTGEAESQVKVAEFFAALESSLNFRDATFVYSERLEGVRPSLYRFEFEAAAPSQPAGEKK